MAHIALNPPVPNLPHETHAFGVYVDCDWETMTVEISGELDLATAPLLVTATEPHLGHPAEVIFELDNLDFVDVVGLRSLLAVVGHKSIPIMIKGANLQCRRLLHLVGLQSLISTATRQTYDLHHWHLDVVTPRQV